MMVTVKATAHFSSPPQAVWQLVTDNENWAWRSDLSQITTSPDGLRFTEYTAKGFPTHFIILEREAYSRYVFTLENANMTGRWTGLFQPEGGGTQMELTEEIQVKKGPLALVAKGYLKKQQARYIADLRRALGES